MKNEKCEDGKRQGKNRKQKQHSKNQELNNSPLGAGGKT
jgi:hypothetical protein